MHWGYLSSNYSRPPVVMKRTKLTQQKLSRIDDANIDTFSDLKNGETQSRSRKFGERKKYFEPLKQEQQQEQQQEQHATDEKEDTNDTMSRASSQSVSALSSNTGATCGDNSASDADEWMREKLRREVGKETIAPADVGIADHSEIDVLTGRGGRTNNLPGNQYFRSLIRKYSNAYQTLETKLKPSVNQKILELIRGCGGRFLRFDKNSKLYYDIGDASAREKISQALRSITFHQRREAKVAEARHRRDREQANANTQTNTTNANSSDNSRTDDHFQEEPNGAGLDDEQQSYARRMSASYPYPIYDGLRASSSLQDREPLPSSTVAYPPALSSQWAPPIEYGDNHILQETDKLMRQAAYLRARATYYESMAEARTYERDYGQRQELPPPRQCPYDANASISNNAQAPPPGYQYYGEQQHAYHAADYGFATTAHTTGTYYACHSGQSLIAVPPRPVVYAKATAPAAPSPRNTGDVAHFPFPNAPNGIPEHQSDVASSDDQHEQSSSRESGAASTQNLSEAPLRTHKNMAHPDSSYNHDQTIDTFGTQVGPRIEMNLSESGAGSYPALPHYLTPISTHAMAQSFVIEPYPRRGRKLETPARKLKVRRPIWK